MPRVKSKATKLGSRHGPTTTIKITPEILELLKKMPSENQSGGSHSTKTQSNFYPEFNKNTKKIISNEMETDNPTLETQPNIRTTNKFGILATLTSSEPQQISSQNAQPTTSANTQVKPTKVIKPPPIIIKSKISEPRKFHQEIKNMLKDQEFRILYLRDETKIYTQNRDAFNILINQLANNDVQFYTFTLKDEKLFKIVLKAAPFVEVEEIQTVLNEHGICNTQCIKLKSNKAPSASFLISTKSKEDHDKIQKIKELDNIKIKWEDYNRKSVVSQYHRCQRFGHGSTNCNLPPRCVKRP